MLINKNPEFTQEPDLFEEADYWIKEKKKETANNDVDNLPVLFSNMCSEFDGGCLKTPLQSMEVSSSISSFTEVYFDGATVTTNIKNDRILQINTYSSEINRVGGGYIRGVLNCRIYGEFYGTYIDLNNNGKFHKYTEDDKKIFDGSFENINVQEGKFIGRLFTGYVSNLVVLGKVFNEFSYYDCNSPYIASDGINSSGELSINDIVDFNLGYRASNLVPVIQSDSNSFGRFKNFSYYDFIRCQTKTNTQYN